MKSLFTIHAGEYLFGSHIESNFKNLNVWIPSKDTGIDILVSDSANKMTISYQIKYSKDFLKTHMSDIFQHGLHATGWWTLNRAKIKKSQADFLVFVLAPFNQNKQDFIIIEPQELLRRLTNVHGSSKTLQIYFWITKNNKCWAARGLKTEEQVLLATNKYKNDHRDFSIYLNDFRELIKLNRKKRKKI